MSFTRVLLRSDDILASQISQNVSFTKQTNKVSRHARHIPPLLHTQGPIDERNTLTRVPPDPRERIIGSQLGWNIDRICREKER